MLESSGCATSISDVGSSGVNGGDEDVDETVKSTAQSRHGDGGDGSKQRGERDFGRAKHVILYPFLKAKKRFRRVNMRASSSPSSSCCSSKSNTNSSDKRIGGGGGSVVDGRVNQGCFFCFAKHENLDSKNGSETSDPNDRKFTHEMLKVLIEKNDFYSKESNPHLVTHLPSCNTN